MLGDGVHGVGVALGLLTNVQLHETQTEAVHLANQIQEIPIRHAGVAHLDQAVVARHEGLQELSLVAVHRLVLGVEGVHLARDDVLQRLPGVVQLVANLGEDDAVRLLERDGAPEIAVVSPLADVVDALLVLAVQDGHGALLERVRAAPHGEVEDEVLDRGEVEVHGGDARQIHYVSRARRRHEGVTVAVAAHPRREAHDGVLHGDAGQTLVDERGVDAAHELGQAGEDGVVEVREPRAHLVLRLGGVAAYLIRAPRRLDGGAQGLEELGALVAGQAAALEVEQVLADLAEVLEHGAAQRLRGVRGEHQVHLLRHDGVVNLLRGDALRDEALDGAVGGLRGPAGDVVEARVALLHRRRDVLGDVVEVEDVG